jgi:ferric-dicitrate binding protein FerR (iron transport regulator)
MTDINDEARGDGQAERALREGLKVRALSAEAMQRIRSATESEWREVTRQDAGRRPRWFAIATSLVGVAAAGVWALLALSPGADGAVLGRVAYAESPGLFAIRRFTTDDPLAAGAALHAGQSVEARGDTAVQIEGGGNLRIARASMLEIQDQDVVQLSRGEVYVDIPPGAHAASSFRVVTSAGEFRHLGTQFAVMTVDGQTRLRVREGQVLWHAANGDSTVTAGTEVSIDRNGKRTQRQIPTAGRDWAWTETLAPDIVIENRPLLEFLQWFARETGRKLDIDDAARQQAMGIVMHGSVKGLTVTEALSAVMATTHTLKYELPEGAIRVSSARDPKRT